VHELLLRVQDALGSGWITPEHVCALLDAENPEAVVANWLQTRAGRACSRCGMRFIPASPTQRRCSACRPARSPP
jgi:hypothetical protein